jgi:hypothetical protein
VLNAWLLRLHSQLTLAARAIATICGFTKIRAGQHVLTAEDPLPPDLRDALAPIR